MRDVLRSYLRVMSLGFRAAPWYSALQLLTGVLFAVIVPIVSLEMKVIVDAFVAHDRPAALRATVVLAVLIGVGLASVFYYVDCLFAVEERAGAAAGRELMQLIGGTEGLAHFENPEYLDQVQRINSERGLLAAMVNVTAGLLRVCAGLAVSTVLLVRVSPWLLLLLVLGVISLGVGALNQRADVAADEAVSQTERLRRHLFEVGTSATGAKELRIFGLGGVIADRHRQASQHVLARRNRASWRKAGLQAVDGVVSALFFVGGITVVLLLAIDGKASAGDVVLVAGLAATLNETVSSAAMYSMYFVYVLTVAKRFRWLEKYAAGVAKASAQVPATVPAVLQHGITVHDVSFGYPQKESPSGAVLNGVSLHLPAGAVVAVVGENGAGKSTLVKLLCGFYRPQSGRITLDSLDLAQFEPREWQDRVAGAFQDFAALEFLVRETVGVGDLPRLDDVESVLAALERAGAVDLVAELPHGLETSLGTSWDDGVEVSGGQWQKLALARGLMRTDPLLVVFDEPTSALDAHTEHALFERISEAAKQGRSNGSTTLLVSHRFSTVRMADLIIVLEGGGVREYGSHAELVSSGGLYSELYELQSRSYR